MEHRHYIENGIFVHDVSGVLSYSDYKHIQLSLYEGFAADELQCTLWNLMDASLLWSYLDIASADHFFRQWLERKRPRGFTAFASSSETNQVLLRQLHGTHPWSTQWQFFHAPAQAAAWLQAQRNHAGTAS